MSRIMRVKDFYELFGVARGASESEIKSAYRKLALKLHPDKNTAPGAEDAFKKVNKAWDILSDRNKRATYDAYGEAAADGQRGAGGFGGAGGNPFAAGGSPFGPGGMGGTHGINLEEILRQFQAQGGMGGFGGRPRGGAGAGSPGGFNFNLANVSPQTLLYAIQFLLMALNALTSLFSLVTRYWYVLVLVPALPPQHRKRALMMIMMYVTMGGIMF